MRPTCAGDSGPRSERAVLRHPMGAEAIDRANRTADAQYNRQSRTRPHGECHSHRRRAQARIGAGYGVLGQAIHLPQYLVPYPNAHFPSPPRHSNAHFPAPPRHSNAHFPAPLRLFPHRKVAPALGSAPIPVPVRSLDTGAGCGGATDSVLTGMPLLVRRNHLAHERPSPGAAHDRPVFTALPRSARATPRGCPAQRLSFARKTARPPPRPARFAIQNSTRRA